MAGTSFNPTPILRPHQDRSSACENRTPKEASPIRIEIWVPTLFLVFGLFSAYVTPIGQVGDEPYHFLRAYHVSRGHFLIKEKIGDWGGAQLPTSLSTIIGSSFGLREPWHRVYMPEWKSFWSVPLDRDTTSPTPFGTASQNSFVPYLGAALAIRVSCFIDDRPIVLFYVARTANLIVSAVAFYFCLRLVPFGRLAMSAVLLMPLTIQQCASLSVDAFVFSFSILLTSALVHLACRTDSVRWPRLLAIQGLAVTVGLCKFPYSILAALIFLVHPSRLGGFRKAIAIQCVIVSVAVATGVVATRAQSKFVPQPFVVMGQYEADIHKQLQHLIESPPRILSVALATVYRDSQHWFAQASSLGWAPTPLPFGSIPILLGIIAAFRLDETQSPTAEGNPLGGRGRLLVLAVTTATLGVILTSFYLWYSPVGGSFAEGVLFRYAIPILPALLLTCIGKDYVCEYRLRREAAGVLISYLAGLEVVTLLTVYSRFYVSEPPHWFTTNAFMCVGLAVFFLGTLLVRSTKGTGAAPRKFIDAVSSSVATEPAKAA